MPSVQESLDFLYSRINYERLSSGKGTFPFRLTRMRALLRKLDDPDRWAATIHIGGTKGKGSTAAMVAAMLSAGGIRTGLYTSPHLNQLQERFQVDGQACGDTEFVELVGIVRRAAERLERDGRGQATFFELTTAIGWLHFYRSQCQAVVLEVGLGGRLDSTNVCFPHVCAITSVGLDHQHILGQTVAEIASEKAGIIKPGIPVVTGLADGPAWEVVAAHAERMGAPLWKLGRDFDYSWQPGPTPWGMHVSYRATLPRGQNRDAWLVPLAGEHQAKNAAVAMAIIDTLTDVDGPSVLLPAQRKGLAAMRCPARIEPFPGRPTVVLDAAHNDDSMAALCSVLGQATVTRPLIAVFGTSQDKDAAAQLGRLIQVVDRVIFTHYHGNPRWRNPSELRGIAKSLGLPDRCSEIIGDPVQALRRGRDLAGGSGHVVVSGSFFLAAELRPLLLADQLDHNG